MFAGVEGAGIVLVQKVLLEFLPVGFCSWVWQRGRDWWWLCPFGALIFLLWWGGGGGTDGVDGVGSFGFVHCGEFIWDDP